MQDFYLALWASRVEAYWVEASTKMVQGLKMGKGRLEFATMLDSNYIPGA